VAFLEKKANLLPEEGFTTAENKICRIKNAATEKRRGASN
jgi:hypothetical protein